jgi:cell shape-determining protein MreC
MLFTWFMLAGCILLFAPQSITGKLQLAFVDIFRWPLSLGGNVALTARSQESYDDNLGGGEQRLRNVISNLEQTVAEYRKKFEKQYKYSSWVWEGADVAVAAVITKAVDGPSNELTIDYRKKKGLVKGQYVLGGESIIGTISDVFPQMGTARVKLITDSTSKIPVKIGNGDMKSIMKGTGGNVAIIGQVKTKVDTGERVFALRKPGFLDLDAPIVTGRVSRCERNQKEASVWDVTVVPVCDIQNIEDVAVIIMNPKAE